ncbi:MAG: protein kinase [Polyangiales bacterium]
MTLPSIGDLVDGRYRIDRKLGEGGTSAVYEVSHLITEKKFAIKWLLPELALDEASVDRFIHEARVGGRFAHRHAVQVYDICKANGSFYMLMELLQGESLQARLERAGRLSVEEACGIMLTCGDVLAAAHRAGIIHRDLKPANIFLCTADGHSNHLPPAQAAVQVPKLLDFGISKLSTEKHLSLVNTASGSVIGTPLYMAPEQMLGQRADPRTDIYAFGAVVYELVSGRPPFYADSYGELVIKVTVEAAATPLHKLAPVDAAFSAIVAKAMHREPDKRYASVDALLDALRPYTLPAPSVPAPVNDELAPRAPSTLQAIEIARIARGLEPARPTEWRRAVLIASAVAAVFAVGWGTLAHKPSESAATGAAGGSAHAAQAEGVAQIAPAPSPTEPTDPMQSHTLQQAQPDAHHVDANVLIGHVRRETATRARSATSQGARPHAKRPASGANAERVPTDTPLRSAVPASLRSSEPARKPTSVSPLASEPRSGAVRVETTHAASTDPVTRARISRDDFGPRPAAGSTQPASTKSATSAPAPSVSRQDF